MVLPSLHFLTPAPAPAAGLARAPGLVWCPGGEYVAAIHAAPPPAHITYQHTSIPHTHQLDTPVQTRAWTQCGLLVRDSLILQGKGVLACPCDDGLQDAGDNDNHIFIFVSYFVDTHLKI